MGRHSSWQAHTARDEDTMEGRMKEVVVFKDVPARLTERQAEAEQARKVAGESKALLQAFAQSYDGESDSSVARRLEHMQETWGCFESKFQEMRLQEEEESFSRIAMLKNIEVGRQRQMRHPLVPTLVLSTREMATGDHMDTFNHLRTFLVGKLNAYTVMLQPSHFQSGAGAVVMEMLEQLAGEGGAEDMQALHQWYEDQTGYIAEAANTLQQEKAQAAAQATQQPQAAAAGTGGRGLRTRKQPALLPGQQKLGQLLREQHAENRKRPVVVVVAGAEEVGAPALRDLLGSLLLDYARFPAFLVLGVSLPAAMYLAGLPASVAGRMAPQVHDLPGLDDRLAGLFKGILLATPPSPSVCLSERPLRAALQRLELMGGGVSGLVSALKSAHVRHHASTPAACLMGPALCGPSGDAAAAAADGCKAGAAAETGKGGGKQGKPKPADSGASSGSESEAESEDDSVQIMGITGNLEGEEEDAQSGQPHNPWAALSLEQAVSQLPPAFVQQLAQQLQAAGAGPASAAGSGQAKAGAGEGKAAAAGAAARAGARKGAAQALALAPAAAQAAVVGAVRDAVDALGRWRLGVRWMVAVAEATGAAGSRKDLRAPALYLAAAQRGLWLAARPAAGARPSAAAATSPGERLLADLLTPLGPHSLLKMEEVGVEQLLSLLRELAEEGQQWRQLEDVQALLEQLGQVAAGPSVMSPQGATPLADKLGGLGVAQDKRAATQVSPLTGMCHNLESAKLSSPPKAASDKDAAQAQAQQQQPAKAAAQAAPAAGVGRKARQALFTAATGVQKDNAAAGASAAGAAAGKGAPTAAAGTAGPAASPSAGGKKTKQALTLAGRLLDWLQGALRQLLKECPFHMPGSQVFTYQDAHALEAACLAPAPRAALHDALIHPSHYLGPNTIDEATALSTDVEVAYQRLMGQDSVLVTQWFNDFCEVMMMDDGQLAQGDLSSEEESEEGSSSDEDSEEEAAPARRRGRGAAKALAAAAAKGKAAKVKTPAKRSRQPPPAKAKAAGADGEEEVSEQRLLTWAARFSHAVSELVHMGVVRPSKRRTENAVQRTFNPTEAALAMYGLSC